MTVEINLIVPSRYDERIFANAPLGMALGGTDQSDQDDEKDG